MRAPARLVLLGLLALCATFLAMPSTTAAQGVAEVDADCGGYGEAYARERVLEHNQELGRVKRPGLLEPREFPDGRYKVWREECSRLDLERDMHAGWRFAVLFASAVFMLAVGYAGILLMVERFGGGPSSQARNVVVGAIFGLLVVAFGMALWRSVLTQVLGVSELEIGYFNPFGMSGAGR